MHQQRGEGAHCPCETNELEKKNSVHSWNEGCMDTDRVRKACTSSNSSQCTITKAPNLCSNAEHFTLLDGQ